MPKPRLHVYEKQVRLGDTIQLRVAEKATHKKKVRVHIQLYWWDAATSKPSSRPVKKLDLAHPFPMLTYLTTRKGFHTLMILIWDPDDPPGKDKLGHFGYHTYSFEVI
jgi:hypothetical protein